MGHINFVCHHAVILNLMCIILITCSPGPREIPGCTGSCQVTYCPACYFSKKPRPLPGSCRTCGAPVSGRHCLKKWAYCVGRANARKYGRVCGKSLMA